MSNLTDRLSDYAASPQGWAVVPTDLLHEAAHRVHGIADVVIPTKSNPAVHDLVHVLAHDPAVGKVLVVGDGADATTLSRLHVPRGAGIHAMWNLGLRLAAPGRHVLFLNDDVSITTGTVSGLVRTLDEHPEVGLVCPNYSGEAIEGDYRPVAETCRGRYDGSGGLGGFAMMLRSTLAEEWRFDEEMKWWYGDDDVLRWTLFTKGMVVAISALATCAENSSWTIAHDPPADFGSVVANDRRLFIEKWGSE